MFAPTTRAIIEGTGEGVLTPDAGRDGGEASPLGNTFLPWLGADMWLSLPGAAPGLWAELYPEFRLLGWSCLLVLAIGAGVLVILWARSWFQADATEPHTLEDYQKLLDAGLLDPEEFERIRSRLGSPGTSVPGLSPPGPSDPTR